MSSTLPPGAIAIVGLAGHFPGARSAREYWRMLDEGRDASVWLSDEDLIAAGESLAALEDPAYVRAAMPLPDVDKFDGAFFGFTAREAAILDPQHRHFLEASWEALEDAAITPARFEGAIGVFAGCGMQAYFARNLLTNAELVDQVGMFLLRHTGNDKDFLTTRVSYLLNLQGPSVGVQTACSTSLVAVHMACQSLLSGECDMALAGGVTIEVPHARGYLYAEGEVLSSTGQCRAFDESGDGTVFGSGAGVVVLRRLEDAVRDGDHIYAIIRGTAINNDGAGKAGYLAPSVEGQARAAAEALAIAQVEPETVSYIEAHGTGTRIGDPIELAALAQAYEGAKVGAIRIGSVKTNIGHLDTAAGVASLIKVALALNHEKSPKTLHFEKPNSRFDFAASPFNVAAEAQAWPRAAAPRRAAINSLGVGGTNAHAILEEAPARAQSPACARPQLVLLSGKTPAALDNLKEKWRAFAAEDGAFNAYDAAYTTETGRTAFAHRAALIVRTKQDVLEALRESSPRQASGVSGDEAPRIVFMFPGGGAQYPGAGKSLYAQEPIFRETVEACFAALPASAPADLRALMFECDADDAIAAKKLAQPLHSVLAVFIIEYALAALWRSWGVTPAGVIGHSLGEYAAAAVAGVMSLKEALSTVTLRGEIFAAMPKSGMLSVRASESRVRALIGNDVDIGVINGPELVVVSGEDVALDRLEGVFKTEGVECARVRIDVAAHSRLLDAHLPRYRAHLESLTLKPATMPMMSNLTGAWLRADEPAHADYWVKQLRGTVRFGAGLAAALARENTLLLEVGPGQSLSALARLAEGAHEPAAIVSSMGVPGPGLDDGVRMRAAAGALWAHGADMDLAALRDGEGKRTPLPTYGFERVRHWIEAPKAGAAATEAPVDAAVVERLAPYEGWLSAPVWTKAPHADAAPKSDAQWLVFSDGSALARDFIAALNARGAAAVVVTCGEAFAQSDARTFAMRPDAAEDFTALFAALASQPTRIAHFWSRASKDAARARALCFDSLLLLGQAMELNGWDGARALCVISDHVVSLHGERAHDPLRALSLGPVRVLPRELPGLRATLIDVAPEAQSAVEAILAEAEAARAPAMVALRQDGRWSQGEEAIQPSAQTNRLREKGVYLLSGGLSALGLTFAAHLARTVKARLVLTTRGAFPARSEWRRLAASDAHTPEAARARDLTRIEDMGGAVEIFSGDMDEADQAASAVAFARETFGALHGVFHLSGMIDDAVAASKTLPSAHAVLNAKVSGALALDAAAPDGTLDVFGVFSSTSALIGPPGQCDYAAANAVMDSLAEKRADGLSMAWGVWADIGMAARMNAPEGGHGVHPLIGPGVRDGDRWFFARAVRPSEVWALDEHRVQGRAILPGTAYLDACVAAARAAGLKGALDVAEIGFLTPMRFASDAPRFVQVILAPSGAGRYGVKIESKRTAGEAWTTHFEAQLGLAARKAPRRIEATVALEPIEQTRLELSERGVAFGPRWMCLKEAWRSLDAAGGVVALAPRFENDLRVHPLHPGVLDVAMTVGLFALEDDATGGKIYAPMSVERVTVFEPLPARYAAHAHVRPSPDDETVVFDVALCTEAGRPLVLLDGLMLRKSAPSALSDAAIDQPRLREDASLFERMLACGIRAEDAGEAFAMALGAPGPRAIVSSIALARLRAAFLAKPDRGGARAAAKVDVFSDPYEAKIAAWCADILGLESIAPEAEFLAYGGGSLTGIRLFAKIRKEMGVDLSLSALLQTPTIRELAALVRTLSGEEAQEPECGAAPVKREWSHMVRINAGKPGKRTIFCVHGARGNVVIFKALSDRLGADRPFYALQARGVDGKLEPHTSIDVMADIYLAEIEAVDPNGPYALAGYSGGGVIAYEIARRLKAKGRQVDIVIMFDSLEPEAARVKNSTLDKVRWITKLNPHFLLEWPINKVANLDATRWFKEKVLRQPTPRPTALELATFKIWDAYVAAQNAHRVGDYDGDVLLFRATRASIVYERAGPKLGWARVCHGDLRSVDVDATHTSLFAAPAIDVVAFHVRSAMKAFDAKPQAASMQGVPEEAVAS